MRAQFDKQLELLHIDLIKMGALCEEAIACAIHALLEYDNYSTHPDSDVARNILQNRLSITEKVFEIDNEIDQMERDIELRCMKLLLQQQPVAKDLRIISSALKMITDMERIGDQAADIAEITKHVNADSFISKVHIKDMAKAAIKMVTDSVDSFVKGDLELARDVIKQDDVVDKYFDMVRTDLVKIIRSDVSSGEQTIDLLMISKYLERIGDHAVNISERVIYSITGEQIEIDSARS